MLIPITKIFAEDQINRLEEDERQFKLENSALLHNSNISQFSGIADASHW